MDLTEAIESNDSSFLDNSEYQDVDAIPLNGPLPGQQYLREEVCRMPFTELFLVYKAICDAGCAGGSAYVGAICGDGQQDWAKISLSRAEPRFLLWGFVWLGQTDLYCHRISSSSCWHLRSQQFYRKQERLECFCCQSTSMSLDWAGSKPRVLRKVDFVAV